MHSPLSPATGVLTSLFHIECKRFSLWLALWGSFLFCLVALLPGRWLPVALLVGFCCLVVWLASLPLLPCCVWGAVGVWGWFWVFSPCCLVRLVAFVALLRVGGCGVLGFFWGGSLCLGPSPGKCAPLSSQNSKAAMLPGGELINFSPPLPSLLRLLLGPAAGCAVGSFGAAVLPV